MQKIVTLSLPPESLNAKGQRARVKAKRKYREDARDAALKAGGWEPMERANVQVHYYVGYVRGRLPAPDSIIACMKAACDGLVDAGVFTDDRGLTILSPVIDRDAENPRVEIHVEAI